MTYWWIVDFPECAHQSFHFLSEKDSEQAIARIQADRGDVYPVPFSWAEILRHFLDPKLYGFSALFFLQVFLHFVNQCYSPNSSLEYGLDGFGIFLAYNLAEQLGLLL